MEAGYDFADDDAASEAAGFSAGGLVTLSPLRVAADSTMRPISWVYESPRSSAAIARGTHVIRRGDTLWDLASRYGVALQKLMTWNRLSAQSVLRPGQRIRLVPP